MLENTKKPVKQFIILYYDAINREDYEMAAKYKKWIENLKKSGE